MLSLKKGQELPEEDENADGDYNFLDDKDYPLSYGYAEEYKEDEIKPNELEELLCDDVWRQDMQLQMPGNAMQRDMFAPVAMETGQGGPDQYADGAGSMGMSEAQRTAFDRQCRDAVQLLAQCTSMAVVHVGDEESGR